MEEGSCRWGKPHVASLSFHAVTNLRECLESGTVLLDLEAKDLPGVVDKVLEEMVMLDEEQRENILRWVVIQDDDDVSCLMSSVITINL